MTPSCPLGAPKQFSPEAVKSIKIHVCSCTLPFRHEIVAFYLTDTLLSMLRRVSSPINFNVRCLVIVISAALETARGLWVFSVSRLTAFICKSMIIATHY